MKNILINSVQKRSFSAKNRLILILFICFSGVVFAQNEVHERSTEYEAPTDPLVQQKLKKWGDQKFGMLIHWGLYAVPGIIESWQLCSEEWIERPAGMSYNDYKNGTEFEFGFQPGEF